jgi:hypothetical protein
VQRKLQKTWPGKYNGFATGWYQSYYNSIGIEGKLLVLLSSVSGPHPTPTGTVGGYAFW